MNEEGLFIQQYIPVSPRNRVMYLTANCQYGLYHTVKECLKKMTIQHEIPTEVSDPPSEEGPPQKKGSRQIELYQLQHMTSSGLLEQT